MICEFKQHELDYADRRKAMNEKNARTVLDNTADDIQEARDDNGCDDTEEEDDNEDEEHGGSRHVAAGMQDEVVIHACYWWHVASGRQDEVDIHACYE